MNLLQRALHMESHVARIIGKQSLSGVQFDSRRAKFYVHVLEERTQELYRKIRPHLSLVVETKGETVWDWFLKDSGWLNDSVESWFIDILDEVEDLVGGSFSRVTFKEPDIGKRAQIVEQLIGLGWKPKAYTDVTDAGGGNNPRITVDSEPCPSLLEIGSDIGAQLAEWYILKHRQSQIKGLLKLVRPDGRISAEAHTIGTPTYRFRHRGVVNIPKASEQVIFGKQMRSLFTVKQGYKLVGHDASGLELRILAHYIDDEDYTKQVSEGDPHTKTQIDSGLRTRDDAKAFIYKFIFGGGGLLLGQAIGGGRAEGLQAKRRLLANNPKLASLINGVQDASKKGWIKGLDGRRVRMRRDKYSKGVQVHKALSTVVQSGGAILMKYSMIWLDLAVAKEGLDSTKVIDMHDEGQSEVSADDAQRHAYLACESIRKAGVYLGARCPMDAEAKVNTRWSKTH